MPRSRWLFSWLASGCLLILLLAQLVGMWPFAANVAYAARKPKAVPGHLTLQQFLRQGQLHNAPHGPFTFPATPPRRQLSPGEHLTNYAKLPPSAEPPTMKPLTATLSSAFLTGAPGAQPLDLISSDQRLEVQLVPGSLDLSHVTISTDKVGKAPASKTLAVKRPRPGANQPQSLQLTITEVHGLMDGQVSLLGQYQFQLTDAHGHAVNGIALRQPFTIRYHYTSAMLASLGLDPGNLYATWPNLIAAARTAHQSTARYTIPLHNDPKTHTLTGQSSVLSNGPLDTGSGTPDNQSPPTPLVASVAGNSGQLSYAYPLTVAPGADGTTPTLQLVYSSEATNERTNRASPASDFGEGWSLSLGAITADEYPAGSAGGQATWYSLSGVDGVSDLLVPNPQDTTEFLTEHISYLRIRQTSANGQPCFDVWDTSGMFYELGCTSDSLQYYTDGNGVRHNYRWDVDTIVPPNEGPGTASGSISVSYLQDSVSANGATTIRDSAIKQIVYGTSPSHPSGTIDFNYGAPFSDPPWANQYATCSLRCDDPTNYPGGLNAPQVMSTLTINSLTSYVGSDSSSSNKDYSYTFHTSPNDDTQCWDDYTQLKMYCAGNFALLSVTPTVYQNGQGTTLPALQLSYSGYGGENKDDYTDTTQKIQNGTQNLYFATYWIYLTRYDDLATGVGATIAYQQAYNNSDGTPDDNGDTRYDPWHCSLYSDCTDNYGHPQDRAWSLQTVKSITTLGTDSSSSQLQPATTTYHYLLTKTGTYSSGALCYPWPSLQDEQEKDCVGDNWLPAGDGDWADYYHSEFRGFQEVDITSPSGDLTVQNYAGTDGWNTPQGNAHNYTNGVMEDEEVYQGNSPSGPLLQETQYVYAGWDTLSKSDTATSCNGDYSGTYTPCEVILLTTRTTDYEGTNSSSAPWVETDNTYDDYNPNANGSGLQTGYHNLQQAVISSSNAATITKKYTYQVTDSTSQNGWVYYNIHEPVHSEIDDSNGHEWACQDVTYDEGVGSGVPQPDAGWPTTTKTYSNCANQSSSVITTYNGYDTHGDLVASVDGVGTANAGFYGSGGISGKNGCPLDKPQFFTSAWTAGTYTTCTVYDGTSGLPTSVTNAFGQTSTTAYDSTQGDLPITQTDVNTQATHYTYSYSGGDPTVQTSEPGDTPPSYTTQSQSVSSCTGSSTLPCFEIDTTTSLYNTAITRTFYDSLGRKVETRTPGPDSGDDTIQFTVYNDSNHTMFQSEPFEVASGTGWLDPNGATDKNGHTPVGAMTYDDALGRVIAVDDALFNPPSVPGISCPSIGAAATACTVYELDSPQGSSTLYDTTKGIDPNNHVTETFTDAMGRTASVQYYSGLNGNAPTVNEQISYQYNALNKPTQVTTIDLAPLNGQSVSSVTTTMQYDDLGRLTQLVDPDRGTHNYTYDADSQILDDTSGSRTIGYNYDLLGRVGCEQSGAVSSDADGSCTTPNNAIIQNTYDTTEIGTQGSTDFPIGRLTKTQATTTYPEGGSTQSTEKIQYDDRGRVTTEQLKFSLPNSWNLTLPTYQLTQNYTDADQPQTMQTSTINGQGQTTPQYTETNVYDQTLGVLTGLGSTTNVSNANLANINYNVNAQLGKLYFQTSTGGNLAYEQFSYDGDLRPSEEAGVWQNGSGQSGQFFDNAQGYDAASNVDTVTTTMSQPNGQSGNYSETQNFCYDEQDRLVWAGNSGTQPAPGNGTCGSGTLTNSFPNASYTNTFSYTHLGQLWHAPVNGTGGYQQYLYCNSQPHQVSDIVPAGQGYTCSNLPSSVPYAVKYDAWGNVTSRSYNTQTATLSYNKLDEMVEWQVPSSNQAWYAYDASGNRTLERSTVGSTTTETVYAFGLEEYSYDSSGNLTSSTHYYSLAGHLIGEAQSSGSSTTTNFFLTDALGSVLAVISNTESSAALLSNQVFSPYGTQLSHNGNQISQYTNKGFTGQYSDPTSGLDYYVSRYYDPVAGVFLSPDVKEGNAAGLNPYAYVGGNPETDTDPTGQYYSNGTQLGEHGGEIAYVSGNVITTVTNDGAGTYWSLDGTETWNSYGGLSINTFTRKEETLYGGYNPDTDASNSPLAKFEAVTGWTQLQQSWNAPGANTQSRLAALGKFAGTNINNVLQLAAIMGGPEDDGVMAAADALDTAAEETVTAATDTTVADTTATATDEVGNARISGDDVNFDPQQVQAKFKHAPDFGVTGNYNKANASNFVQALKDFIDDPATQSISGTYRGQPVTHFFNPSTLQNVMIDPGNNFISGWILSSDQANYLLTIGNVQ